MDYPVYKETLLVFTFKIYFFHARFWYNKLQSPRLKIRELERNNCYCSYTVQVSAFVRI
jgi:hypothetical protein